MLLGHVDTHAADATGWAIDTVGIEGRCALDIEIDGRIAQTTFSGAVAREDVEAAYPHLPTRHAGFRLDLTPWLQSGSRRVRILFNRSGEVLPNGAFDAHPLPPGIEVSRTEDGFLCYRGDRNGVVDQMSGALKPSLPEIDHLACGLALAERIVSRWGGESRTMIVPDRLAVAPWIVAPDFVVDTYRTAPRLVARAADYGVSVLYPLEALRAAPASDVLLRGDTHLSHRGFATIFDSILATSGSARSTSWAGYLDGACWKDFTFVGDLARHLPSPRPETTKRIIYPWRPPRLFDTHLLREGAPFSGNGIALWNERARSSFALVYGASSSTMLARFIARKVRLTLHVWSNVLDAELIESLRPDHLFFFPDERMLFGQPGGIHGSTSPVFRDLAGDAVRFLREGLPVQAFEEALVRQRRGRMAAESMAHEA
jgi:hypothetical protein